MLDYVRQPCREDACDKRSDVKNPDVWNPNAPTHETTSRIRTEPSMRPLSPSVPIVERVRELKITMDHVGGKESRSRDDRRYCTTLVLRDR